jgi:hypothetical protein
MLPINTNLISLYIPCARALERDRMDTSDDDAELIDCHEDESPHTTVFADTQNTIISVESTHRCARANRAMFIQANVRVHEPTKMTTLVLVLDGYRDTELSSYNPGDREDPLRNMTQTPGPFRVNQIKAMTAILLSEFPHVRVMHRNTLFSVRDDAEAMYTRMITATRQTPPSIQWHIPILADVMKKLSVQQLVVVSDTTLDTDATQLSHDVIRSFALHMGANCSCLFVPTRIAANTATFIGDLDVVRAHIQKTAAVQFAWNPIIYTNVTNGRLHGVTGVENQNFTPPCQLPGGGIRLEELASPDTTGNLIILFEVVPTSETTQITVDFLVVFADRQGGIQEEFVRHVTTVSTDPVKLNAFPPSIALCTSLADFIDRSMRLALEPGCAPSIITEMGDLLNEARRIFSATKSTTFLDRIVQWNGALKLVNSPYQNAPSSNFGLARFT